MGRIALVILGIFLLNFAANADVRCTDGNASLTLSQDPEGYVARVQFRGSGTTIEYLACEFTRGTEIIDCSQTRWDYSRQKKGFYIQRNNDGATYTSSYYVISGLGVGLNGMIPDNKYYSVSENLTCQF